MLVFMAGLIVVFGSSYLLAALYYLLASSGLMVLSIGGIFVAISLLHVISASLYNITTGRVGFGWDEYCLFVNSVCGASLATGKNTLELSTISMVPYYGIAVSGFLEFNNDDRGITRLVPKKAFQPSSPTLTLAIGVSALALTAFSFMATRGAAYTYLYYNDRLPEIDTFSVLRNTDEEDVPAHQYLTAVPGNYTFLTAGGANKRYLILQERCCNSIFECQPLRSELAWQKSFYLTRQLGYDPDAFWQVETYPHCYDVYCVGFTNCNALRYEELLKVDKQMSIQAMLDQDVSFAAHGYLLELGTKMAVRTYGVHFWIMLPHILAHFFAFESLRALLNEAVAFEDFLVGILQLRFIATAIGSLGRFGLHANGAGWAPDMALL